MGEDESPTDRRCPKYFPDGSSSAFAGTLEDEQGKRLRAKRDRLEIVNKRSHNRPLPFVLPGQEH